jgi:hypothetical protein
MSDSENPGKYVQSSQPQGLTYLVLLDHALVLYKQPRVTHRSPPEFTVSPCLHFFAHQTCCRFLQVVQAQTDGELVERQWDLIRKSIGPGTIVRVSAVLREFF